MGLTGDILPDSRSKGMRGAQMGPGGVFWVPIYCANCGDAGGLVPEDNCTFAFWLCEPCARTYGMIAGTMFMPDEVFWEKLNEEQLESRQRLLTPEELATVVAEDASPLATLIKEGR